MGAGAILVLNAGSSSLKFTVFEGGAAGGGELLARGQIEAIGTAPKFLARGPEGEMLAEDAVGDRVADARGALQVVANWLRARFGALRIAAVGHRIVHGGSQYQAPTRLDSQVVENLRALVPLAPLHQAHNLAAIEAAIELLADVPQVGCFDTSFHRGKPAVAELVALPAHIRESGVRRYGFHGLSYEYIAAALVHLAPGIAAGNVIVAHLGNGASLCALRKGASIDCTFGFSALDGLCMGTRPGSMDPGVILHLLQGLGLSVKQVEALLYHESGLRGISGISNDMRVLQSSDAPAARLAIDYFVYRAAQEIGALTASLGGLDALVFTAGIGENSPEIRRRICEASAWLGVELDSAVNEAGGPCISKSRSRVSAWTVPTNEELMIARHTVKLLGLA